jgi:phage N-6-adenine-methyltransferase
MSSELIELQREAPEIPEQWDYDESVTKVGGFVYKWKNVTGEIIDELWIAHTKLALPTNAGRPSKSVTNVTNKTWEDYCDECGISKMTAHRWFRRMGYLIASTGDFHVSTGEVEWYTPPDILDGVRSVMGKIDCDPASSEMAQETVKAERYYTAENNGLEQPWEGDVFLNPPYAMPLIEQFAARSVKAIEARECKQITILTNNSTDTDWFQSLCRACELVCFTDGRVRFYNNEGETLQARQGQSIFYWGPNRQQFIDTFKSAGVIFAKVV